MKTIQKLTINIFVFGAAEENLVCELEMIQREIDNGTTR